MKKTAKKFTSFTLAFIMLASLCLFGLSAQAQDGKLVRVQVVNNTYKAENGAPWTGVLFDEVVEVELGANALDAVKAALSATETPFDLQTSAWTGDYYIAGINGISEGDGAAWAGWMCLKNDWSINNALPYIEVKNGDVLSMNYSLDAGADLGAPWPNDTTALKSLEAEGAVLSEAASSTADETASYDLTLNEGSKSVRISATAQNKANQVRIYKNEYAPKSEEYFRTTDDIPVIPGDVIYVGVGNSAWPGSPEGVAESVYTLSVTYNEADYKKGDVNLDGKVDITDATLTQMKSAKLIAFNALQDKLADVDGNNKVDISDATIIQMMAVGLVS